MANTIESSTSTTPSNTTSSSQPCTCLAGCPKCVASLAPAKGQPSANPRNVALKAMRSLRPARGLSGSMVLKSTTPGIQRRAGSKAARCVEFYTLGATIDSIVASAPLELQSYTKACLVWDYQHGYIEVG